MVNNILLQVQEAPVLQSTQKIEVVIGVIAVVFAGIVAYMISVDRRLKKLEDKK
jgi:CcmD family protein